ncbi:MAG: hypothetical protein Q7T26_04495 [Dehalococcoidia bacterium]|nr:hypothetical protein [Dehalococcoidia bacterium]
MQDTALVALLYAVTAASSGVNALYFLRYRASALRRRVGAAVMAGVCLAGLAQGMFYGLFARAGGAPWPVGGAWLPVAASACVSSLLVSALIARHALSFRGRTRG